MLRWYGRGQRMVARKKSISELCTLRRASTKVPRTLPYKPAPKIERQHTGTPTTRPTIESESGNSRNWVSSAVIELTHRGRFGSPVEWVVYATATFLGIHVFYSYFYSFDTCSGVSMMPTIFSFGEWVCISKYYRRGRGMRAGDLVSFKSPIKDGEQAIKRLIGLPGDFVLMNTPGKSDAMIQIPEGHCWVVGDNLAFSRDSRVYGPLPMGLIIGKVLFKFNFNRYLPWDFETLQEGLRSFDESEIDVD